MISPYQIHDSTPQSLSHPRVWNVVLYDEDGSFSGAANSSIVSNHPMMLVGDEFQPSNWVNAYRSPHKFALSIWSFQDYLLIIIRILLVQDRKQEHQPNRFIICMDIKREYNFRSS